LYATDFSLPAERALPYALSLAQESQAVLHLLHVDTERAQLQQEEGIHISAFRDRLHTLVPEDAELWCQPKYLVSFGSPAGEIVRTAAEVAADLVVIGAHGAGRLPAASSHFLGGTAYEVVSKAPCAVLTIPLALNFAGVA
jgi:nucleotide-binding universal stress UspA family protein